MSVKVKDHPGLLRDPFSKAIISGDKEKYNTYIEQRERMKKQQEMINQNNAEIETLKNDIKDIKSMLMQIASQLKGN